MSSTSSPSSTSSNNENRAHSKAVLKSLQNGGSKMPKKNLALRTYTSLAHWIPLGIDMFIDFSLTIYAAIDPSDEPDEELLSTYEAICTLEPRITDILKYLNKDPDQLTSFIRECEEAINGARSDDTTSLKPAVVTYVL
ncbi:hypothetical protein C0991_000706 [Blastosporella zonata]|nr:hypothetical protein C0991_000706 [Blastosporella zonata]